MGKLRCGAAERCVTPPLGRNIPSCMVPRYATGVKDDIYTHALVVEDGEKTAVLISVDTSALGTGFTREVRRALEKAIGVDPRAVMVSAIHIHTGGPQLLEAFWGQKMEKDINELFLTRTVEAAVEAYRKRVPVKAYYGEGSEDRIAFRRHYRLQNGAVKMNPGRKHAAEIVSPVGEIDRTVGVLRFDDFDGKPVAEIVNFACHPDTVGGTEYSADYPGAMRRYLKEEYGEDMTVVFFNGCSGNLNHVDAPRFADPEFRYPADHYQKMGRILADDVIEIGRHMTELSGTDVSFAHRRFRAPRRQPTAEHAAWAEEILNDPASSGVNRAIAKEWRRLVRCPKHWELIEMQAIRVGDFAISAFPGEPFSDIGLRLRARAPFKKLMISELANNTIGYLATEPVYSTGVYEAMLASSCVDIETIDKMIDVADELLRKL